LAAEQPSAVIAGLDPALTPMQALPPGNRAAEFSAGPNGGGSDGNGAAAPVEAQIRVPGLSVSPAAAAVALAPNIPRSPIVETDRAVFRRQLLSSARADRERFLRGSTVYTLAIDMPNISSQEGSWILRFTEVGGSSPEDPITPPAPILKVDPKYIASAAAEGVEGKVLLYAVIRRDGQVDRIRLVQGIDERLDTSAVEAFAKWQFQPATRNGEPVDLEATVQIPFRLGRRR
jgi:TonB family protein